MLQNVKRHFVQQAVSETSAHNSVQLASIGKMLPRYLLEGSPQQLAVARCRAHELGLLPCNGCLTFVEFLSSSAICVSCSATFRQTQCDSCTRSQCGAAPIPSLDLSRATQMTHVRKVTVNQKAHSLLPPASPIFLRGP